MEAAYTMWIVEEFRSSKLKSQMPVFAYSSDDAKNKYRSMRGDDYAGRTEANTVELVARPCKLI